MAEAVAKEADIEGFPTLKFYSNQQVIPYSGGRNMEDMQSWIESYFTSKISSLSEAEVKDKIGSEDFALIQGASPEELESLKIVKFLHEDMQYYNLEGSEGDLKITIHLKNSKTFEYTGELNVQAIKKWAISSSTSALVGLIDESRSEYVFENEGKLPAFLLAKA